MYTEQSICLCLRDCLRSERLVKNWNVASVASRRKLLSLAGPLNGGGMTNVAAYIDGIAHISPSMLLATIATLMEGLNIP